MQAKPKLKDIQQVYFINLGFFILYKFEILIMSENSIYTNLTSKSYEKVNTIFGKTIYLA